MRTRRERVEFAKSTLISLQHNIEDGEVKLKHTNMSEAGAAIVDDLYLDAIIIAKQALNDWLEINNKVGG